MSQSRLPKPNTLQLRTLRKEIVWFRRLLGEIFRPFEYPITLYSDNQASIALPHTQGQFHARTKHIDIRYHYIRYTISNGGVQLIYCPTEDMTADIFTKALPSGRPNTSRTPSGFFGLQGSVRIQTVRTRARLRLICYYLDYYLTFYCALLREHTCYGYMYPRILTSGLRTAHSF